jgi:hypothetical protein
MKLNEVTDWTVALGSLGYGVVTKNPWWVVGGLSGIALAIYNPGNRIRNKLLHKFSTKHSASSTATVAPEYTMPVTATVELPAVADKPAAPGVPQLPYY